MITFSAVWWFKIMVDRGDGFTVNGFMFVLPILTFNPTRYLRNTNQKPHQKPT